MSSSSNNFDSSNSAKPKTASEKLAKKSKLDSKYVTEISCASKSKSPSYKDWSANTIRVQPVVLGKHVSRVFPTGVQEQTCSRTVQTSAGPINVDLTVYSQPESDASGPYNPLASDFLGLSLSGTVLIVSSKGVEPVLSQMVKASKKPSLVTGQSRFAKSQWADQKESLPKDTSFFTFSKGCVAVWNNLTAEQKQPYEAEALAINQEHRAVYDKFLAAHPAPPSNPRTAQSIFASDKKAELTTAPDWNALSEEAKAEYRARALLDVARYETQYAEYVTKCESLQIRPSGPSRRVKTTNDIKQPRAARVAKPKVEKAPKEPKPEKVKLPKDTQTAPKEKAKRTKKVNTAAINMDVDQVQQVAPVQAEAQAAVVY